LFSITPCSYRRAEEEESFNFGRVIVLSTPPCLPRVVSPPFHCLFAVRFHLRGPAVRRAGGSLRTALAPRSEHGLT
jgi:hypothetical protein